jgi:asparagine N-glycosylation enzyme membrane subunit Stt3
VPQSILGNNSMSGAGCFTIAFIIIFILVSEEMRIFSWNLLLLLGLLVFTASLFAMMFYAAKTNNYFLLIAALLIALIFGWFMERSERKERFSFTEFLKKLFRKKSS